MSFSCVFSNLYPAFFQKGLEAALENEFGFPELTLRTEEGLRGVRASSRLCYLRINYWP